MSAQILNYRRLRVLGRSSRKGRRQSGRVILLPLKPAKPIFIRRNDDNHPPEAA